MKRTALLVFVLVAGAAVVVAAAIDRRPDPATETTLPGSTTSATATTATTTTVVPETTTSTVTTLAPGTTVCDAYGEIETAGTVAAPGLVEASGLATGRVNPDVLWTHNDSRDGATLYAIGLGGEDRGSYPVRGGIAFDWEDIAAGPGPTPGRPYLYVGDIGDNFAIREGQVSVYRLPEPPLGPGANPVFIAEQLVLRYPEGEALNAEAMFVDPTDAALYIVTRNPEVARVYRADAAVDAAEIQELRLVVSLPLGDPVTGADISYDGGVIALRGERTVWMWHRPPGVSVADAMSAQPCSAPSPEERQGEAIAFDATGSYRTLSEGSAQDIHLVSRG